MDWDSDGSIVFPGAPMLCVPLRVLVHRAAHCCVTWMDVLATEFVMSYMDWAGVDNGDEG